MRNQRATSCCTSPEAGGEHQDNRGQVENIRTTGVRWRISGRTPEQVSGGEHQDNRWQVENIRQNTRRTGVRWRTPGE